MNKKVTQELDEILAKLEATEEAANHLAEKGNQLRNQLTRLSLLRQVQNHGVARNTPSWIVNGRNKIEVNPSPR